MNKIPQISILIANYNNGHFFRDAYDSLLKQTFDDWEAVVIDDASTDSSAAVIRQLIKDESRMRFYKNPENIGYQKTILRAISYSRAAIFGRLDPDDALHPEALACSVETHRQHPDAGLVYSNIIGCDSDMNPTHVNRGRQVDPGFGATSFHNLDGSVWPFSTFKRAYYDQTSGMDVFNRRAEDQDLYLKMAEIAPMVYVNRDLYFYRVHNRGASVHDNSPRAYFWHWVALAKMMERRQLNLEDLFSENLVDRSVLDLLVRIEKNRSLWLTNTWVGRLTATVLRKKL